MDTKPLNPIINGESTIRNTIKILLIFMKLFRARRDQGGDPSLNKKGDQYFGINNYRASLSHYINKKE